MTKGKEPVTVVVEYLEKLTGQQARSGARLLGVHRLVALGDAREDHRLEQVAGDWRERTGRVSLDGR